MGNIKPWEALTIFCVEGTKLEPDDKTTKVFVNATGTADDADSIFPLQSKNAYAILCA
ncbi:MAG: hypothetical protein IJ812_06005 [Schwartzia sp.]|nr:hypothetical protein [Schwartzia sp. (in: firmicutes)]MBR1885942.1 hypothetical protein [Schwartzia sp. (in: firmicutes)]